MIAFSRAQADALANVFARMASTQPNLYHALLTALRDADRAAADAVVGEEDADTLLRRQGAARQLRALLVLANTPVLASRSESAAPTAPQL